MTTIAYNHKLKEISCDSRVTSGDFIITDDEDKIILKNDIYFILSGEAHYINKFINEYPNNEFKEEYIGLCGIIVENKIAKGLYSCSRGFQIININYNDAFGSGCDHAITALDLNCNSHDAVYYSSKRDCKTGGKIKTLRLSEL